MSEVLPPPFSPRKRPFPDGDDKPQETPLKANVPSPNPPSILSTPLTMISTPESPSVSANGAARQPSPAPSTSTSLSSVTTEGAQTGTSVPGALPQKRRKLTPQEKEAKRLEKEAKEKVKAEGKAKRD